VNQNYSSSFFSFFTIFVFKTGSRGTGYYRDGAAPKKEIVKKEKKEEL
jgi:hypothetical protein